MKSVVQYIFVVCVFLSQFVYAGETIYTRILDQIDRNPTPRPMTKIERAIYTDVNVKFDYGDGREILFLGNDRNEEISFEKAAPLNSFPSIIEQLKALGSNAERIKKVALERNVPPELACLLMGLEANYQNSRESIKTDGVIYNSTKNHFEETMAKMIMGGMPYVDRVTGLIRAPIDLTIGISQRSPAIVFLLVKEGYLDYDMNTSGSRESLRQAFDRLFQEDSAIEIEVAFLQFVYEQRKIMSIEERSKPENIIKAAYAHMRYRPEDRLGAFENPRNIFVLTLTGKHLSYPNQGRISSILEILHSSVVNELRKAMKMTSDEYSPIFSENGQKKVVVDIR